MSSSDGIYKDAISTELGSFIVSKSSTFACGGAIPIKQDGAEPESESNTAHTSPFALRWDSGPSVGGMGKLTFPIDTTNATETESFSKLVKDCEPASFGYKGGDVFDDTYRKATKLERSAFSVDFCPYELGIIDKIAQVLFPNADGAGASFVPWSHGVKAELYKLNVYGAPSGFFKSHVDTPRSDLQFGSLVVSLPCYYKGGELVVRHAGHSVRFDWGASGHVDTSVQWAAFYSDCEHEVLEVTEGNRVTLTYNLYCTSSIGTVPTNGPTLSVQSLPLYQKIQEALTQPEFMPDGGYLGIHCQHAYAHSTRVGARQLPGVLKGSDMAVYSVFQSLGLRVDVKSVLDRDNKTLQGYTDYPDSDEEEVIAQNKNKSYIRAPGEVCLTWAGAADGSTVWEILEDFGGDGVEILWLTKPQHAAIGLVHPIYGNDYGVNAVYSYAALVVNIPPAASRSSIEQAIQGLGMS